MYSTGQPIGTTANTEVALKSLGFFIFVVLLLFALYHLIVSLSLLHPYPLSLEPSNAPSAEIRDSAKNFCM